MTKTNDKAITITCPDGAVYTRVDTKATKTKRTPLKKETARPPREVRDNKQARMQWLREKLAEINATANREGKIVGTGSYQEIRVYEVKEVEGRLRLRGACQFCGHSQVVNARRDGQHILVLHGYTRPGDGHAWGRCPGVDFVSLNETDASTKNWLLGYRVKYTEARAAEREAREAHEAAHSAFYEGTSATEKAQARREKPRALESWINYSREERDNYEAEHAEWAAKFTLNAAYEAAARELRAREATSRNVYSMVQHFETLLAMNITGKPLTQEVVAS